MRLALVLLFAFALVGGAVAVGVILQLRRRSPSGVLIESRAHLASHLLGEDVDRIRVESRGPFLSVEWTEGSDTRAARLPRYFADARWEEDALRFDYLPGVPSAARLLPMPAHLGRALLEHLRDRLDLPRSVEVLSVDESTLRRDPSIYNGRLVRVTATWRRGFEASTVAGLWISPPDGRFEGSRCEVRILGLVLYSGAARGHGHLGGWEGEIVPFQIVELPGDVTPRATC